MRTRERWQLFLCCLTLAGASVSAQDMFVTDKLVLNVYAEPDQESERLQTLETGDSVEMIEQLGNFYKVRLEDGREGWVGANYLTMDVPAQVKLRALEKEQKAASQKAEQQLKGQIASLEKQNAELAQELKTLKEATSQAPAPEPTVATEPPKEEIKVSDNEDRRFSSALIWAPFVLVAGGLGFAAGYQTLARKIQNKFGGVKIYQ